jgi:hypothetical protein
VGIPARTEYGWLGIVDPRKLLDSSNPYREDARRQPAWDACHLWIRVLKCYTSGIPEGCNRGNSMKETGMYVLMDKDHRSKVLPDQPWPVTEEAAKQLYEQGYLFQASDPDKRRAIFVKSD